MKVGTSATVWLRAFPVLFSLFLDGFPDGRLISPPHWLLAACDLAHSLCISATLEGADLAITCLRIRGGMFAATLEFSGVFEVLLKGETSGEAIREAERAPLRSAPGGEAELRDCYVCKFSAARE